MKSNRNFWSVLGGVILGMALIACSCGSLVPLLTSTPTRAPLPTRTPLPTTAPKPTLASSADNPLPGLEGNWQAGATVFTIRWQDGQYAVTAIHSTGTSTRTINSQSWDGSRLTWEYTYSDENGDDILSYTTVSVSGDNLTASHGYADGTSTTRTLHRIASTTPEYSSLPWSEVFSDPASGWDIFSTDQDSAGYKNGTYFVVSRTNEFSSYGAANRFFGDTVIDVDATPLSGPADSIFSYNVACREQDNGDGYLFEIEADGYYAVGYFTGGGNDYVSLLSGDTWQPSKAIHPGLATNHTTLTCAGNQLTLAVNGQVLYQGQDSTFTEGDISLGAATYADDNTPAEVQFDNLKVKLP